VVEAWERAEILLENMRGDIKLVLEGHSVLDKKIENLKETLDKKIEDVKWLVKEVDKKVEDRTRMLDKKIEDKIGMLDKKIEDKIGMLDKKVEDTRTIVKEISRELKEHIRMPAHRAV
jgi:hypothetical protein